jgi:hypothetical protein
MATPDKEDKGKVTHEALRLTRKVVAGFNGDEDALVDFLLLIDIFERNTDDPIYLNAVLGTVRHLIYGKSDRADDQSREFLDSIRTTFPAGDEDEQAH